MNVNDVIDTTIDIASVVAEGIPDAIDFVGDFAEQGQDLIGNIMENAPDVLNAVGDFVEQGQGLIGNVLENAPDMLNAVGDQVENVKDVIQIFGSGLMENGGDALAEGGSSGGGFLSIFSFCCSSDAVQILPAPEEIGEFMPGVDVGEIVNNVGINIGDGINQLKDMNLGNKIKIESIGNILENAKDVIGDQIENLGDIKLEAPILEEIDVGNTLETLGKKIGDGLENINLGDKINIEPIGEVMKNAKDVIGNQVENLPDFTPKVPSLDAMEGIDLENAVESLGDKIGDGMNELKNIDLGDKINIKSIGEVMENSKNIIGDQVENLGDIIPTNTKKVIDLENLEPLGEKIMDGVEQINLDDLEINMEPVGEEVTKNAKTNAMGDQVKNSNDGADVMKNEIWEAEM